MRSLCLACGCVLMAAKVAAAQDACGPRLAVDKKLFDEFGETPVGAGFVNKSILYITANPDTGTFTILLRRPDGQACIVMGGTGFAMTDAILPGENL